MMTADAVQLIVGACGAVIVALCTVLWWQWRKLLEDQGHQWKAIRDLQKWEAVEKGRADERERQHMEASRQINEQLLAKIRSTLQNVEERGDR